MTAFHFGNHPETHAGFHPRTKGNEKSIFPLFQTTMPPTIENIPAEEKFSWRHAPRDILAKEKKGRHCCRVLVGICTAQAYVSRRQAVRETWLARDVEGVHAVFFHGKTPDPTENPADTIELNVADEYNFLPAKVLAFFRHALEHYDFEWIFKCDDDTYLAMDRLLSMLDENYGLVGDAMLGGRGAPSGGAGYLLSRKTVEQLVALDDVAETGPEDLIIGRLAVNRLGIPFLVSKRLCSDYSRIPRKDNDFVSAHWCSPQKMRIVHALYTEEADCVFEGTHRNWHDSVLFYKNGLFCRKSSGCTGQWNLEKNGRLFLHWHEWPMEKLEDNGAEFVSDGFSLKPTQGSLKRVAEAAAPAASTKWNSKGRDNGGRILLFRCHSHWEKCRETLRIIRHFNPHLPLHFLYGGSHEEERAARKLAAEFAESYWSYRSPEVSPDWKWQHSEIMIREWYEQHGSNLSFSHLYSFEWDILPAAPFDVLFPRLQKGAVYASPVRPFTEKFEKEWTWTHDGKWKDSALIRYFGEQHGIHRPKHCILGPGMIFPREFLERYCELPPLSGVHEELAIPALAEAFGTPLVDTGLFGHSRNTNLRLWNTQNAVRQNHIQEELATRDGMRIFHPVKFIVTLEELLSWKAKPDANVSEGLQDKSVPTIGGKENATAVFKAMNANALRQPDPSWGSHHDRIRQEIQRLNQLPGTVHVLEWGSGISTGILCDGLKEDSHVLSIEHDPAFHLHIPEKWKGRLTQKILRTQMPFGKSENYVTYPLLKHLTDGIKYDLILVDGRNRADCLATAAILLKENGVVILHDAQRSAYQCNFSFFEKTEWDTEEKKNSPFVILEKPVCNLSKNNNFRLTTSTGKHVSAWGVCAVALPRESHPWLRDWIGHHLRAGAKKIVIYDNTGSSGSTRPGTIFGNGALQRRQVSKRGERYGYLTRHLTDEQISRELRDIAASFPENRVEIITWRPRNPANKKIIHGQVEAYCDYIRRYRDVLEWSAFLDLDEYIYCAPGLTMENIVSQLGRENPDIASLQLQSWVFECRWGTEAPKDITTLLKCAPNSSQFSNKSFVRLADVTHANIHMNWRFRGKQKSLGANPDDFAFCHYNQKPEEFRKAKLHILPREFLDTPADPTSRLRLFPATDIIGEGPLEPMHVDSSKTFFDD
jgi:hypothetical protein